MKEKRIRDICVTICFGLLVFFMASILIRFLTKQILVDKLGWDNAFTRTIFLGDDILKGESVTTNKNGEVYVNIDWESLYPFLPEDDNSEDNSMEKKDAFYFIKRYEEKVDSLEEKVEDYSEIHLLGHELLTRIGKKYNALIGCEAMPMGDDLTSDTPQIILLNNGYLTYQEPLVEMENIIEIADNISAFSEYLSQEGIYFLYANTGSKICPSDRQLPPWAEENTNENGDHLLEALRERNVPVLDYREYQQEEFEDWYGSYYKTDHHWKTSTALWAAGVLAENLNKNVGFDFDQKYFEKDSYVIETRENYFLGGQGRVLTTAVSELEPFEKIIPKFDTDFSIQIPDRGLDLRGEYSQTLFREDYFESIADYELEDFDTKGDAYNAVTWRNHPLGTVQNHACENNQGKRILMLQDSFGWYLSTYLATDVPEIDFLYLPGFTGSLKSYINETKPDAVVLLLSEYNLKFVDQEEHASFFDFR